MLSTLAAAIFAGCAGPRPSLTVSPASVSVPGTGVLFSDEISRDLVRQTRQLLALREMDYLVGPDDVLEVSIFEWELSDQTKTLSFRVTETGIIALPALGAVQVAGKTIQEVQAEIEKAILARNVLQNPRVGVAVVEYRSRRIAVIGEVTDPGVYAIHENVTTLLEMLTLAGGPTPDAGQKAFVLRKQQGNAAPLRITVNLQDLFDTGAIEMNPVLQGDDVVFVPRAPMVYVYGSVQRPGGFSLRRPMRVLEAVSLAGGFSSRASKRGCFIARPGGHGGDQFIPADVTAIERGKAPDVFLQEGDVLHVPDDLGKTVATEFWSFLRGIFTFTYRLNSDN